MEDLILKSLTYLLIALVNVIAYYLYKWLDKHKIIKELESKKELVQIVVKAVQEGFGELKGAERFDIAKDKLVGIMNEKGLKISENELDLLIDSVVKEMKLSYENWKETTTEQK